MLLEMAYSFPIQQKIKTFVCNGRFMIIHDMYMYYLTFLVLEPFQYVVKSV